MINLKAKFQFSFATPSYIYPANIKENLQKLKDSVDEIELILFEGDDFSNMPSSNDIKDFINIAKKSNLKFNVHLPLDVDIASKDYKKRTLAVKQINKVYKLTKPLLPTSYTLHIYKGEREDVANWKKDIRESLNSIIIPKSEISVETLDYDLRIIDDILTEFDLRICLDVGHLILNKMDIKAIFNHFIARTTIIHFHGVKDGKDHIALNKLDKKYIKLIGKLIKKSKYSNTLVLEIFSLENLENSVDILEEMFLLC